jgi:hypothetical protein
MPIATGAPKVRNPVAWIAAALTSLFCGLLFAAAANWVGYAVHRPPPDAAEARQLLGEALPGVAMTIGHVPAWTFEIYGQPATPARFAAEPGGYGFGYMVTDWSAAPPGASQTVAAFLAATGWSVSEPYNGESGAPAIIATVDDNLVIVEELYDGGLRASLRRDSPQAVGAAVVFGLAGVALTWWTIAQVRRRMNLHRVAGSFSVVAYVLALMLGGMVVGVAAVMAAAELVGGVHPQSLAVWNLVGLPVLMPGYLLALVLMLVAIALARVSGRPHVGQGPMGYDAPTWATTDFQPGALESADRQTQSADMLDAQRR